MLESMLRETWMKQALKKDMKIIFISIKLGFLQSWRNLSNKVK